MKSIDVELGKIKYASAYCKSAVLCFVEGLYQGSFCSMPWMPAMCGRHLSGAGARSSLRWSRQARCAMSGAIYEPRIDITYSSDTRLFTIEDNGIGINEYDLEHFIAQIGASYYTSTDFFNQQLKYEPYSHYGIGLCSCFTVSKAVLIESKKG